MPHIIKACDNCNESFICFMVKDRVWAEAGFDRYNQARLCLLCFEKKLRRRVTSEDLMTDHEIIQKAIQCNAFFREALTPL